MSVTSNRKRALARRNGTWTRNEVVILDGAAPDPPREYPNKCEPFVHPGDGQRGVRSRTVAS